MALFGGVVDVLDNDMQNLMFSKQKYAMDHLLIFHKRKRDNCLSENTNNIITCRLFEFTHNYLLRIVCQDNEFL